jgi:hypothetical protein
MDSLEQIRLTYKAMATNAKYRPSAPSDGLGNMPVPEAALNLEHEAYRYAEKWWASEDDRTFYVGCCDFRTRPATIFAIVAARLMCSGQGGNSYALKLLKMAVKELESVR